MKDSLATAGLVVFFVTAISYAWLLALDEPTAIKSAENIELSCERYQGGWCGGGE